MDKSLVSTDEAKQLSADSLFQILGSNASGLSSSQAEKLLQQYGPNEIPEKHVNPVMRFLAYFWGPIPWMIEAALVMSALAQRWPDFSIIFLLLALNATVGFWQEHQAGNAIELLKQRLAVKTRVERDGNWQQVPARVLVPGDIVRIRLGDIVPADVKLIEGEYLLTDESALTGESLPVEKKVSEVAYAGSIARQGEMNALVVNTGIRTFFGRTTKLVEETQTQSHFQKAVMRIGDYLIVLAIALVAIIILISLFRGQELLQLLQFALVLTVAAIPAALPAVLSVTMAIGATALAKKEAIVSKLVAVEEMAGMDVLCADKTGTITKNELTVSEVKPIGKFSEIDVLALAASASRREDHDPIDDAILNAVKASNQAKTALEGYHVSKFTPFDPVSKRTEATISTKATKPFKVAKGATQAILSLMKASKSVSQESNKIVEDFAQRGHRALAVGKTDAENAWELVGLIALYDPPREDSATTIATAESMGINVKMITGDHIAIAKEIAKQVKIGMNIALPASFVDKPDVDAERAVEDADGFAEVFPEHKHKIVALLQKKMHIVGMTGDGVNDAPALKKADVGVAVAGATDAAKSAASIVLTKPGISVIVDAIKQSRMIFQRMSNYAVYRIAETIRLLFFITASIIAFQGQYPITALMIVLLAILNDLPVITIAYDNVRYSNQPEKWQMRTILGTATVLGMFGVMSSFGILYIGMNVFNLTSGMLQSFIYLKLSVAGHMTLLLARTKSHFWTIKPGRLLLAAIVLTQLTATLITVYGVLLSPIGWGLALFVWGYAALTELLMIDLIKTYFNKDILRIR